ncbi:hypothetical protein AKJ37_06485, partial [candidate division MSBL1 archaeon SCGC-AAA259I09]
MSRLGRIAKVVERSTLNDIISFLLINKLKFLSLCSVVNQVFFTGIYVSKIDRAIVIYQIHGLSQAEKAKFRRELYGYVDKSNRGQYEYYRPSLLDEIPYRKLIRCDLLIRKEDKEKITDFM